MGRAKVRAVREATAPTLRVVGRLMACVLHVRVMVRRPMPKRRRENMFCLLIEK